MIDPRVLIVLCVIEISLHLTIMFFVDKTNKAIKDVDSPAIRDNFKVVKYLVYSLLCVTYLNLVLSNFVKGDKKGVCCSRGLQCVTMAGLLVLFVFLRQIDEVMCICEKEPVPVEKIVEKFKLVSDLANIVAVFTVGSYAVKFIV